MLGITGERLDNSGFGVNVSSGEEGDELRPLPRICPNRLSSNVLLERGGDEGVY